MDSLTIQLNSVTVFWEDLGLPKRRDMTASMEVTLAKFWDTYIEDWLKDNCVGHVNPHDSGVWFAEANDAILFKLTWAGNFEHD